MLWGLHNVRLRVLLAGVASKPRRSIVRGVNEQVLETYHEGDASSEAGRLREALGRLGTTDDFLPDLMHAHDLGLADIRFAHVLFLRSWPGLAQQVAMAFVRLAFALMLAICGLAVSLISAAALVAPTRFGLVQTEPDSFQLLLLASEPLSGSLLTAWVLVPLTVVGLFAVCAGVRSAFSVTLELVAKASNLFRPWREQ
ncbi:MAG: hypothetical protein GC152_06135 [Alphaproteobacteria bacterium]|nr:hypothetical protein [Alphaproteobacteria bacterium]